MAKQTITRLLDDLDKSEATRTVQFSWDGVAYEIDLNEKNVRAFEQAVAPYVTVARRQSGSTRRSAAKRAPAGAKLDLGAVRAWATTNGHKVAERGRIPGAVLEAFHSAHDAIADLGATAEKATAPRKIAAKKAPAKKAAAKKAPAKKAAARKRTPAAK